MKGPTADSGQEGFSSSGMNPLEAAVVEDIEPEGSLFDAGYGAGLGAPQARELTRQIRVGLEHSYTRIITAYRRRAWLAMGYSSWDAYCQGEFGNLALQPPREERQAVVLALREAGMSSRAIVSATGLSKGTVARELKEGAEELPDSVKVSGAPNGAPKTRRVVGIDGKSYEASSPVVERRQATSGSLFEDVPLSNELLALSPDEVGIGVLAAMPMRSGRERGAASRRLTGSADAPLPMVIRLAGEIALDPAALVVVEDTDAEALSELVSDASRGVLALSHILASIDSSIFAGNSSQVAVVSAAVTDAVGELGRFLDDVHAGLP